MPPKLTLTNVGFTSLPESVMLFGLYDHATEKLVTPDEWLDQFCDELLKLRQHFTAKFVRTIALERYDDKEQPRLLAREYDASLRPKPAPARKRSRWS